MIEASEKNYNIPILKAENDLLLVILYQWEGLYFSDSSKYQGLYSVFKDNYVKF